MLIAHQLGKHGLTQGFIELLEKSFKNSDLVKITVLRSATRNRDELETIAQRICEELKKKLNKKFVAKIVGFTIFVKKWRR